MLDFIGHFAFVSAVPGGQFASVTAEFYGKADELSST